MHPNSESSVYPLERLTKLYDGIEQLEDDGWADDMSAGDESEGEVNGDGVWLKDDEGVWRYRLEEDADAEEWEETEYDEEGDVDKNDEAMDVDEHFATNLMAASLHAGRRLSSPDRISALVSSSLQQNLDVPQNPIVNGIVDQEGSELGATAGSLSWKRFDMLASAPHDHAFYASIPAQPSKNFLGRLTKEYRVLSSSLPGVHILTFFHAVG
jgi:ubiquitin-conjugating enzyme E2 O